MDSGSSATRLIIANCNRCHFLIGEFKRQMTAFETLAGYNSMLTSNFLIQTLREVIGKFQTGDNLGFVDSSQRQVECTNQSTSTDDLELRFPTHSDYDGQNTHEPSQYSFNYKVDPAQNVLIKQEEDDNNCQPPILIPQVETENPDGARTRRTRSQNYGSVLNETNEQMNLSGSETITSRGRVVKRHFNRKKKTWGKNKRNNNIKSRPSTGFSGNYHQNEERDVNFTPLTSERLREANEHIKGVRKLDEEGRYRTFYECTICHKSMTVKVNAAFHVRRVHFQERLVCPFASAGCTKMFYDCRLRQNHKRKCPFKPISDLSSNGTRDSGSFRKTLPFNMKNSGGVKTKTTKTTKTNTTIPPILKIPEIFQRQKSKPTSPKKTDNSIVVVSNPFPNFDLKATLNVKVEVERLCLESPQPWNLLKFIKEAVKIKQEPEQVEEEKSDKVTDKSSLFRGSAPTPSNDLVVNEDLNLGLEMEVGQEKEEEDSNQAPIFYHQQQEISHHTGILFVTEEEYAEAIKEEENPDNKQDDDDDHLHNQIEKEMQLLHR